MMYVINRFKIVLEQKKQHVRTTEVKEALICEDNSFPRERQEYNIWNLLMKFSHCTD